MVANSEEAMGEYVKALVRLDALDGSRLAATLQVRRPPTCGLAVVVVLGGGGPGVSVVIACCYWWTCCRWWWCVFGTVSRAQGAPCAAPVLSSFPQLSWMCPSSQNSSRVPGVVLTHSDSRCCARGILGQGRRVHSVQQRQQPSPPSCALPDWCCAACLQRGAEASFAARGLAGAGSSYLPPPAAAAAASNLPWYAAGPQAFGGGGGSGGGGFGSAAAAALAAAGVSGANNSGGGGELGSVRNPLVVTHAEPSLMSQV